MIFTHGNQLTEFKPAYTTVAALIGLILSSSPSLLLAQASDEITELDAVVVEEEGEPEAQLPLGVAISAETLITAPGSGGDPVRTLQALPGLAYADDEAAVPAVRGSRPGDNRFYVDFLPSNYLFHFDGILSVFNADLVKSFSIYPSAYGPEFSGVTGGVFDIELRNPNKERFRKSIDISLLHAGALIEGPISENQSFYLAGRFSYLDLFLADQIPEEDGIKIVEFPRYSDYQGKYVWDINDENELIFQFNGASDTSQVNIAEDSVEIDNDPIFAGSVFEDSEAHDQAIVLNQNIGERWQLKSALSHTYSDDKGQFGGVGSIDIESDRYYLRQRTTYALNDSHDLVAGVEIVRDNADIDLELGLPACSEFEPDCRFSGAEQLRLNREIEFNGTSAYLKDNWYVNDQLTLYPGLAFHTEDLLNEQFVEPRLALEYSVDDSLIFSAGAGVYNQFPGFLESDSVFGNTELEYINSVHGLLGVQKKFEGGWDVKSELYYKSLDNLITTDDELRFTNDGDGSAFGLDTLIRKDLSHKLSGWLSVSLSKVERRDKRTGQTFAFDFDQPVNVNLVGNYKFSKKWSAGAKLWVHSGRPYTPIIGATPSANIDGLYDPIYGDINSDRFPTFHRLDFRVDRTFRDTDTSTIGAYLDIINVLGTENAAGYDYNADYTERELSTQLSRFFSIGFKATF